MIVFEFSTNLMLRPYTNEENMKVLRDEIGVRKVVSSVVRGCRGLEQHARALLLASSVRES